MSYKNKKIALKKWCNHFLQNSGYKRIKNLHSDWKDGKAICYLIQSILFDELPTEDWKKKINKLSNTERYEYALNLADEHMQAGIIMDPPSQENEKIDSKVMYTQLVVISQAAKSYKKKESDKFTEVVNYATSMELPRKNQKAVTNTKMPESDLSSRDIKDRRLDKNMEIDKVIANHKGAESNPSHRDNEKGKVNSAKENNKIGNNEKLTESGRSSGDCEKGHVDTAKENDRIWTNTIVAESDVSISDCKIVQVDTAKENNKIETVSDKLTASDASISDCKNVPVGTVKEDNEIGTANKLPESYLPQRSVKKKQRDCCSSCIIS